MLLFLLQKFEHARYTEVGTAPFRCLDSLIIVRKKYLSTFVPYEIVLCLRFVPHDEETKELCRHLTMRQIICAGT